MDETLQELENELQRLTPRRPSAAFMEALERELATPSAAAPTPVRRYTSATSLRSWKWASWPLAGAAAAVVMVVLVFALQFARKPAVAPSEKIPAAESVANYSETPAEPVAVATNRYEPVQATSVLYAMQEGDPTTLPDRTEGRAVRYRYVDTYTWKNPATNASLRWSVPRDEVRLIRASLD